MMLRTSYDPTERSITYAVEREIINQESTNEQMNAAAQFIGRLTEELHRKGALSKKSIKRLLPQYQGATDVTD